MNDVSTNVAIDSQGRVERLVELIWNDQRQRANEGRICPAESYLADFPELLANESASIDIIYHEFLLRELEPKEVDPNEFYNRFPQWVAPLQRQISLRNGLENLATDFTPPTSIEVPPQPTLAFGPDESASDEKGEMKLGRFQLGKEVGRGSFSVVYEATDSELGKKFAVKLPRPELVESGNLKHRMLREARVVAQLYHPSIVSVHEMGEQDGLLFIVTDFVDGTNLEQQLKSSLPSHRTAAMWISTIAEALHYAHQNGVVHRDVKPANILVRDDGRLLLSDFGLAHLADSNGTITQQGDIVGTPSYMSPEQAKGQGTDHRSDIYSLGVVLYQSLTGTLPFKGSMSSILHRVVHEPVRSLRRLDPKIPHDLDTIVGKCLEKDPGQRYSNARHLADDLNRFLSGEPIRARPVHWFEKLLKLVRRRPRTSALVMTTMVLLGFLAGGILQLGNVTRQRDRAQVAEKQSVALLATSAFDAGRLAKQRGRIDGAVKHFLQSQSRGYTDSVASNLQLAECYLIQGKSGLASECLDIARQAARNKRQRAEVAYWRCELSLQDSGTVESLVPQIQQVPLEQLTLDHREFLMGMLSTQSLTAMHHFRNCLQHNPFHHSARRSYVMMMLALARFDDALNEAKVSRQLFPEDDDFVLMESLASSAVFELEAVNKLLDQTKLDTKQKAAWLRLCQRIKETTTPSETDIGNLLDELAVHFLLEDLPQIQSRRWYIPPKIAARFSQLFSEESEHRRSANLVNLASCHPEGTLLVLAARALISDRSPSIEDFCLARDLFEQATKTEAFGSDAKSHARLGSATVSLTLAFGSKHEPEKNIELFVGQLSTIDPMSIDKPSHLRTFSIVLINQGKWTEAKRWASRWVELDDQPNDKKAEGLWHYGVILEHEEEWLEVLQVCNQLLELDPEFESAVGLRTRALAELRAISSPED